MITLTFLPSYICSKSSYFLLIMGHVTTDKIPPAKFAIPANNKKIWNAEIMSMKEYWK
jgi:hypothetical protein